MIKAIFAIDEAGALGHNNRLPWPSCATDLKHFQKLTTGSTVVMGRKSWDSLPFAFRPLPNRTNIVVSRNKLQLGDAASVIHPFQLTQYLAEVGNTTDIFIIGGAQLLLSQIHKVQYIYLSIIDGQYLADTFIDTDLILVGFRLVSESRLNNVTFREYIRCTNI